MIYVHVPFCHSICSYCDFHHDIVQKHQVEPMIDAIVSEVRERWRFLKPSEVKTLYIGGGTPSVLSINQLRRIVEVIGEVYPNTQYLERTIELNPDDVTQEYLEGLKSLGFDRISMGVQSFVDEHLKNMNRRHDSKQALESVKIAQSVGFDNISIDLIYGMPFLSNEQWQENLDTALAIGVQHLSAYHLSIEPNTQFARQKLTPVNDEISQQHYDMLRESTFKATFEHYEISNFALPDRRAIHNSAYWNNTPYLGIGASAHSYNGTERQWNISNNQLYISGTKPDKEILSQKDIHNETIMTRLRTADGLLNPSTEILKKAIADIEAGYLINENNTLKIPAKHFLISDTIIAKLFD